MKVQSIKPMPEISKILIVDDHQITRQGLISLLSTAETYEVCGILDRGLDVVPFIQKENVDVILLDINLPDINGTSLLAQLIGIYDMTVIILTGEANPKEMDFALKMGARAIVSKSDPVSSILTALETTICGETYLSPEIEKILSLWDTPKLSLSPRQMAILHYLAKGETNKEIGYRLKIAPPTVSFHLGVLRKKLSVSGNKKIVAEAIKLDLI